jgi:hypothetical protein
MTHSRTVSLDISLEPAKHCFQVFFRHTELLGATMPALSVSAIKENHELVLT